MSDKDENRFWENEDMDASIIRMEITAAATYAAMAGAAFAAPALPTSQLINCPTDQLAN